MNTCLNLTFDLEKDFIVLLLMIVSSFIESYWGMVGILSISKIFVGYEFPTNCVFCCQGPILAGLYILGVYWPKFGQILLLLGIQILVSKFLLILKRIYSHFAVYFKHKHKLSN